MRTERWRFIRYADGAEELYDHSVDPYEWTNLVDRASFDQVRADLVKLLPKQNARERKTNAAESASD